MNRSRDVGTQSEEVKMNCGFLIFLWFAYFWSSRMLLRWNQPDRQEEAGPQCRISDELRVCSSAAFQLWFFDCQLFNIPLCCCHGDGCGMFLEAVSVVVLPELNARIPAGRILDPSHWKETRGRPWTQGGGWRRRRSGVP